MLGPIPEEVLAANVTGVNLVPGALRRQLVPGGETLLVFLRQLGCLFCRETIADLRACADADPVYPKVLLFSQGSPMEARALLRGLWPNVAAVSDPHRLFYAAFGVERGGLWQLFGPAIWRARERAEAKGHTRGTPVGDVRMMPGALLVRGEAVVWEHAYRHAADHPEFARIPELARAAGEGAAQGRP